jgi:hypothetical protein
MSWSFPTIQSVSKERLAPGGLNEIGSNGGCVGGIVLDGVGVVGSRARVLVGGVEGGIPDTGK